MTSSHNTDLDQNERRATLTSAVPAVFRSSGTQYGELSDWYLARLRKNAFFPDVDTLTPRQLIAADNQLVDSILSAHSRPALKNDVSGQENLYKTLSFASGISAVVIAALTSPSNELSLIPGIATLAWVMVAVQIVPKFAMPVACAGLGVSMIALFMPFLAATDANMPNLVALIVEVLLNCFALWCVFHLKAVLPMVALKNKGRALFQPMLTEDAENDLEEIVNLASRKLRESLERATAIVDYASEVVCSFTADLHVSAVNPRSQLLFGLNSMQVTGLPADELVTVADRDKLNDAFRQARQNQETCIVDARAGSTASTHSYLRWTIDWSNSSKNYFCVIEDVTEQTILEQRKQHFVSMISHDLKSPLTALDFLLEMLGSGVYGELNEIGKESVKSSNTAVRRLIQMVNQLLDIERYQNGGLTIKREEVDLFGLAQESTEMVQGDASRKKMTLDISGDPVRVLGDEVRLMQVVTNLLSNAIKYSPDDSSINIKISRTADEVKLSVLDEGRGIPDDEMESVFDRYQQVRKEDQYVGAGLGLAISKEIIEAHGGKIGVARRTEAGTEFWFALPALTE